MFLRNIDKVVRINADHCYAQKYEHTKNSPPPLGASLLSITKLHFRLYNYRQNYPTSEQNYPIHHEQLENITISKN